MKIFDKLQDAYWTILPYHWRPGQLWYRFRCWIWHRYSTVKPRNLPHTWVDRCELMPHTMFEILSDFIEEECGPDGHVEWYGEHPHTIEVSEKQVNVRDEMQDLYNWWHQDYLKNIDHIFDEWHEHREKHVKDVWSPVEEWVEEWVESLGDSNDDLYELDYQYSSNEAKAKDNQLFKEAREKEIYYHEELARRLHRLVNVIPFMWT